LQKISQTELEDAIISLTTEARKKMLKDDYKGGLPLHTAVERNAPDSTILALLHAHPEAAAREGRLGGTSLHLAAQQELSPVVLVALIRACPEALDKKDNTCHLPCDYFQENEISREALTRPSACWIEDIEKEEFYRKVSHKKTILRQKIEKLQTLLELSKMRRKKLEKVIRNLEIRLKSQDGVLNKLGGFGKEVMELFQCYQIKLNKIRDRIITISEEISTDLSEEEVMMRSLMKRTYMQGVQRQYEKIRVCIDQIRRDIDVLNSLKNKHQPDFATMDSRGLTHTN